MKTKALFAIALAAMMHTAQAGSGQPTLIGWNNLGMHCMDDDYSVFSILPPFNTVDAQFINSQGKLVTLGSGVTVTYEAVADPDGSINRTSVGKSNFWESAPIAFGATLAPESGLAGTRMPGLANTPQTLTFNAAFNWFEVLGFPVTPVDDAGHYNPYLGGTTVRLPSLLRRVFLCRRWSGGKVWVRVFCGTLGNTHF